MGGTLNSLWAKSRALSPDGQRRITGKIAGFYKINSTRNGVLKLWGPNLPQ